MEERRWKSRHRIRKSDGESEIVFGPRQAAGIIQERRKSPQTRRAGTHTLTQREERDLTSSQRMCFFFNVRLAVSAPRQPLRKNLNRRWRVMRFIFVRSLSRLSRVFLGFFFFGRGPRLIQSRSQSFPCAEFARANRSVGPTVQREPPQFKQNDCGFGSFKDFILPPPLPPALYYL